MKKCTKCNVDKPLSEFYKHKTHKDGLKNKCKECCKKQYQKHYHSNKDKAKEYNKKYYQKNKDKLLKNHKQYQKKNQDKILEKAYKWRKQRRLTDIEFKLHCYLRNRINHAIRNYNFNKKNTSIEELGCSIQKYVVYLEQQFDENMNWGNYGTYWEIDHIHPISKGGSFHYINTQPLTIEENRSKSDKI